MGVEAIPKDLQMTKLEWWGETPCKGMDEKVFFPDIARGYQAEDPYAQAKKVCAFCPHRNPCLELAMEAERFELNRYGMFGGKTPRQRHAIQRLRDGGVESE
jgi:WhiB family redox-sensing transcriptional regulator